MRKGMEREEEEGGMRNGDGRRVELQMELCSFGEETTRCKEWKKVEVSSCGAVCRWNWIGWEKRRMKIERRWLEKEEYEVSLIWVNWDVPFFGRKRRENLKGTIFSSKITEYSIHSTALNGREGMNVWYCCEWKRKNHFFHLNRQSHSLSKMNPSNVVHITNHDEEEWIMIMRTALSHYSTLSRFLWSMREYEIEREKDNQNANEISQKMRRRK